jgi:hypothetical protein
MSKTRTLASSIDRRSSRNTAYAALGRRLDVVDKASINRVNETCQNEGRTGRIERNEAALARKLEFVDKTSIFRGLSDGNEHGQLRNKTRSKSRR